VRDQTGLAHLGCLLGVQEWAALISAKCVLQESAINRPEPEIAEMFPDEGTSKMVITAFNTYPMCL